MAAIRLKQSFILITCLIFISTFIMLQRTTNQLYNNQQFYNITTLKQIIRKQQNHPVWWMNHLNITELYNLLPDIESGLCDEHYGTNLNNETKWILLNKFNLTNIEHRLDPQTNLNDRILLFHLQLVNRIDSFIFVDHPLNSIEIEIDRRRQLGRKTNLKISELKEIVNVVYGARLCDQHFYGANLSIVIFVFTKPNDFKIRSLIRNTWAKQFQMNANVSRLYFVFGRIARKRTDYERVEELIRQENDNFHDIIQWTFEEDYFRLTIKSLATVRWASTYCPLAEIVFKVDSDALINYDNLIRFCDKLKQKTLIHVPKSRFSLFGNLWNNTRTIRTHKSKFYTSFKDYLPKVYPLYSGSVWLMNGRSNCLFLYLTAIKHAMPALLWEDIYISGIVPGKLKQLSIPFEQYQMPGFQFNVKLNKVDSCVFHRNIIFSEQINENNLETIWNQVNQLNKSETIQKNEHCIINL